MGFGFAAPDYMARAQAGLPLDPNAPDQSPMPAAMPAAMPAPAPQAAAPQGQPYKPGLWDILQGVIFDGQSPAEAAMAARQRSYQAQQMQMMASALQNAPPERRLAMLLNPGKLGEEMAKNFGAITTPEGATQTMFGGPGSGGSRFVAAKTGFDEKSGKGYTSLPGLTVENGPSLGGDFSVSPTGVVNSGRTGPTGQTVSQPLKLGPGEVPNTFTPALSGPGAAGGTGATSAPQTHGMSLLPPPSKTRAPVPAVSSLLTPDGHLDPSAFFTAFGLPHEGGLNARDLNGSPTKYGINAASNPGVDLSTLTPQGAAQIFKDNYFGPSGAGNLSPAMAAVVGDTAFINPRKAKEFQALAGNDPSKFMDLRDAWLGGIVAKNPKAQVYAQAWSNRNADLRSLAAQLPGGQAAQGDGHAAARPSAPGWSGASSKTPTILDPHDPANAAAYKDLPAGTVLQRAADGTPSVLHEAEYSPSVRAEIRGKFMSSDPYSQHIAAASALSALQHNIGQMTGPAAYTILDTMARTINPGAVARQGTIAAIEGMMGVPAHVVGSLQNYVGAGKIPLSSQQAILNAVTPFAQAHYDEAKRLSDANAAIAKAHKFAPEELTAPLGNRPAPMFVTVPPAPQRQTGALYVTPKGPMQWTGTGWRPAN